MAVKRRMQTAARHDGRRERTGGGRKGGLKRSVTKVELEVYRAACDRGQVKVTGLASTVGARSSAAVGCAVELPSRLSVCRGMYDRAITTPPKLIAFGCCSSDGALGSNGQRREAGQKWTSGMHDARQNHHPPTTRHLSLRRPSLTASKQSSGLHHRRLYSSRHTSIAVRALVASNKATASDSRLRLFTAPSL